MTYGLVRDVVVLATLAVLVLTALSDADGDATARERARAECEARNRAEEALRALHVARGAYYRSSGLTEVAIFEERYLAAVGLLPDCG